MNSALVVIDVQESFRTRPYFAERDVRPFLDRINALIGAAQSARMPIVRVYHVAGPDEPGNAFSLSSGHVVPLQGLSGFDAALTVHKSRHSAFVGTPLEVWSRERGIGRLVIAGIRTEQCCETTARHASDLGFAVSYVPDATLTFDMQLADGTPFPAADIKARTAAVLRDRFASIDDVAAAVAG